MTNGSPPYEQLLSSIGDDSATAVKAFLEEMQKRKFAKKKGEAALESLAEVLMGWSDDNAALVINAVAAHLAAKRPLNVADLARWIRSHQDNPDRVVECLAVDPPEEISIIAVLSEAGSQKVVYLANWATVQREVVLKRFIGDDADKLMPREMLPHPLSMEHPNIIETHPLTNKSGERFLVERRLAEVLNDQWSANGVLEASNLLHDIGSALAFLQNRGLVHGDVKPDNIGYEGREYILLDFGICRPITEFTDEVTATGSLRTRAPELLVGADGHSPQSDVWALGATVFNACVGRFPLFKDGESPPRVSRPEERSQYEEVLADRVHEWEAWIDPGIAAIEHNGLRTIVAAALAKHTNNRPSADALVKDCRRELSAFVRSGTRASGLSATETIRQLEQYLGNINHFGQMPIRRQRELLAEINELQNARGLADEDRRKAEKLKQQIPAGS